jgi:hypothetical protein
MNLILVRAHSVNGDVWQTQETTVNGSDSGWRTWQRPLFTAGGPSYTDVHQGGINDCWLMSALAEVAARSPGTIEDMFFDNGDGTVTVRLYPGLYHGTDATPRYITVDTSLALQGSVPINDLWVAVAEKAYAQAFNVTVPQLDHGGDANVPLTIITSLPATPPSLNADTLANDWLAGKLICLCTANNPTGGPAGNINGVYIVSSHWYAMVVYNPLTPNSFMLFNPWGVNGGPEPNGTFCAGIVNAAGWQLVPIFTGTGEVGSASQSSSVLAMDGPVQPQQSATAPFATAAILEPSANNALQHLRGRAIHNVTARRTDHSVIAPHGQSVADLRVALHRAEENG